MKVIVKVTERCNPHTLKVEFRVRIHDNGYIKA